MKSVAALAAAAAILGACNKEATVESEGFERPERRLPSPDSKVVTFFAALSQESYKSELSLDNGKLSWTRDEAVFITDGQHSAIYSSFYGRTDTTRLFHFSGDTLSLASGTVYRAIIPADAGVTGTLPAVQTYCGQNRVQDVPMVAEGRMLSSGKVEDLVFRRACGVLRFNLTCPDGDAVLDKVILTSDALASAITLECGGRLSAGPREQNASFNVMEGEYGNLHLRCISTDGTVYTAASPSAVEVTVAHITDVYLTLAEEGSL